jgi:hypothetical protein
LSSNLICLPQVLQAIKSFEPPHFATEISFHMFRETYYGMLLGPAEVRSAKTKKTKKLVFPSSVHFWVRFPDSIIPIDFLFDRR